MKFKPRKTFIRDLQNLQRLDNTIIEEVKAAIEILLSGEKLPKEFRDHQLQRDYTGYREFHLRDTPKKSQPSAINDVIVIYKIDDHDLCLIGVRIGSHRELFH